MKIKLFSLCFFITFVVSPGAATALQKVTDVKVLGTVIERSGEFCADFRLNTAEATKALLQSRIVSKKTYLDEFDYLPCFVYGTAKVNEENVRWVLRAGGNGTVDNGVRVIFLGCEICREMFGKH